MRVLSGNSRFVGGLLLKTPALVAISLAMASISCVTVPDSGYSALSNNRDLKVSYDRVWTAIVSTVSERASIKNIDKASGLLTTEDFSLGSGFTTQLTLQKYAHQPPNFLGTWGASRGSLTFFVTRKGEITNVRVTARFHGFEENVTKTWMEWPTNGVLENEMLDRIGKAIR